MNFQKVVSDNVKARGYYDNQLPDSLVARHVAKLIEEIGEVTECIYYRLNSIDEIYKFNEHLADTARAARNAFDYGDWSTSQIFTVDDIKSELADVAVVLLSMSEIINATYGDFDVLQQAVKKSKKDIDRGVR